MNRKNWILITGAAKGLGAYLAENLALDGYPVLIHYYQSMQEAVSLKNAILQKKKIAEIIQGDFSSKQCVQAFISKVQTQFPNIYAIIHNVGNYENGSFLNTDEKVYDELMQVNLTTPYLITKSLISSIKKLKGHIIFLGVAGLHKLTFDLHSSVYTLSKHSLKFLMKSLAKELASFSVNVNMISPGYLENSIIQPQSTLPMQRMGKFKDIHQMVQFLLKSENDYITGQDIEIAGAVRL